MGLIAKSVFAGLVGVVAVSAQCTGPPANDATVSLVAEFEGFSPDICQSGQRQQLIRFDIDAEHR